MRVWNGTAWQDQAASPDTLTERTFLATAGQTSYTVTGGYRVNYTFIWVNGALLYSSDYTATNGTTITFSPALALNDEVRILSFKAVGTVAVSDITGLQTALDAKASLTGAETLTNKTLTNPTVTNYVESVVAIGTVSSSSTIALTNGTVQTATLTASTACTFTMPTATAGKSFILLLKQAASTGNGTATFTGVKWGTAGAPTITATAGKMDILTFVSDGTNWYGSVAAGYTP